MILLFGCAKRIVSLVILVGLALAAWHYRADLKRLWNQYVGHRTTAAARSPEEDSASAQAKFHALLGARPPARTAFSQGELQALMRTRFAPVLPRWVDSAHIDLEGDKIRLSAKVPVARIPQVKELGEVAGLLPDSPEVAVKGQLIPVERGGVMLAVDQVSAAHIPVPRRLIAPVVSSLKRPGDPSPPDALRLPLPRTVSSAYVRNDSLVVMSGGAAPAAPAARPR